MSREALSLDISRVVSRVVSGEPIDTAENGAALAAKYPDLGMSPALISQAIERAAGMVGMIRNAPEPVRPPRMPVAVSTPKPHAATNGNGHAVAEKTAEPVIAKQAAAPSLAAPLLPVTAMPVSGLSIDDDLAAAIDAEIGNLVSGQRAKPIDPEPVSDAGDRSLSTADATPTLAVALPEAAMEADGGWIANGELHPDAEPTPDSASAPDDSATKRHEQRGSILSSFRRALFRT